MRKFENIYQQMMGFTESTEINNEFENGECEKLYEKAYDARLRISQKIDGDDSDENFDALCIVDAYEKMIKILCKKCYQYGFIDGHKTFNENK